MNPIDNFIQMYMNSQDFLTVILPEDPRFNTDYMLLRPNEKEVRLKLSLNQRYISNFYY